jgi:hypothetical protein
VPGTLYFWHLVYTDDTAYSTQIEIAVLPSASLQVEQGDNRPCERSASGLVGADATMEFRL